MKYYSPLIFIAFLIVWFVFMFETGTINSGLHFQDDHEIVSIDAELQSNGFNLLKTALHRIDREINVTHRFRPFYYLHRVIEVSIFRTNFYNLSLYNLFLIALTSWLLFHVAFELGLGRVSSIFFPFINLIGEQTEIGWMLGPAETIGIVMFALSIFCLTKSSRPSSTIVLYQIGYPLFLALSALSKESFILLIPATIFLQLWLETEKHDIPWSQAIIRNLRMLTPLIIFFVVSLAFIKFYVGTAGVGYAGLENTTSLLSYYQTLDKLLFSNNLPISLLLIQLAVIAALTFYIRREKLTPSQLNKISFSIVYFIFLLALLVLPQIILYTKSGLQGRYMIPATFGIALIILGPIAYLKRILENRQRLLTTILLVVTASIYIYPNFLAASRSAVQFTQAGLQSNGIIRSIQQRVVSTKDKYILVVIDPTLIPTLETSTSLITFIRDYLKKDNPVLFQFSVSDSNANSSLTDFELALFNSLKSGARKITIDNVSDKSKISNIIIFPSLEGNFKSESTDWFNPANYKRIQGLNFVHYYE
jgi:hypothetical protein